MPAAAAPGGTPVRVALQPVHHRSDSPWCASSIRKSCVHCIALHLAQAIYPKQRPAPALRASAGATPWLRRRPLPCPGLQRALHADAGWLAWASHIHGFQAAAERCSRAQTALTPRPMAAPPCPCRTRRQTPLLIPFLTAGRSEGAPPPLPTTAAAFTGYLVACLRTLAAACLRTLAAAARVVLPHPRRQPPPPSLYHQHAPPGPPAATAAWLPGAARQSHLPHLRWVGSKCPLNRGGPRAAAAAAVAPRWHCRWQRRSAHAMLHLCRTGGMLGLWAAELGWMQ